MEWFEPAWNWIKGLFSPRPSRIEGDSNAVVSGNHNTVNISANHTYNASIASRSPYQSPHSPPPEKDDERPGFFNGWFYLKSDPVPRKPLCPSCYKDKERRFYMRKIANNQQARDHPLKWDYFCDDCESTHKVQRDDYTEFMKRMGENKDNHDY